MLLENPNFMLFQYSLNYQKEVQLSLEVIQ